MNEKSPALLTEALTQPEPRPEELSEIEKLVFPEWLDHDSATGGPDYLGYSMLLMPTALLTMLAICAIAVA